MEYARQPPLSTIVALHVLPGAITAALYGGAGPWVARRRRPSALALLPATLAGGSAFEFGYLLYQGNRRNGRLSLDGVVLNRDGLTRQQYVRLMPPLLLWSLRMIGRRK